MKMRISGSHVLTFCHNIVYTFLFYMYRFLVSPYLSKGQVAWDKLLVVRGGGGTQQIFLWGGSTPKVHPRTPLYVIFHEKGTTFVYLILTNRTLSHILFRTLHPFNLFNRNQSQK